MKNFWAYISNDDFYIGTTGQTVYVYGKNKNEICKFKDIKYGYLPMLSPGGETLVIKSTEGRIAVYNLQTLFLYKKIRFTKDDGAQDDGCCFSTDGTHFINISSEDMQWYITYYNSSDFSVIKKYKLPKDVMLTHIEHYGGNDYVVLGLDHNKKSLTNNFQCFIGLFDGNNLTDKIEISEETYDFYRQYIDLKISGFTQKSYELYDFEKSLEELKEKNFTLCKLFTSAKR